MYYELILTLIYNGKEQLKLTDILREILRNDKCRITDFNHKITLFNDDNIYYPENCIEIYCSDNKYVIYEVHRDEKQKRTETSGSCEAAVYAAVLFKKLHDNINDRTAARNIRNYINSDNEEKAIEYISSHFDDMIYSIEDEEVSKISLIKSGNKASVKFYSHYIAKDIPLNRGYLILYNYCEKLNYILSFYNELKNILSGELNENKILKLYILGKN